MKKIATKLTKLSLLALLPLVLIAAPASAQLTLNLTPADQFGSPGDTLYFSGTLSNPTADIVYLNGYRFDLGAPVQADLSPFTSGAPFTLDPAGTVDMNGTPTDSYSGGLFDLMINPDAAPGTYYGTFAVLGGADDLASNDLTFDPTIDPNTGDPLHNERFSVTVLPSATQPIPELSSTVSFGTLLMLGSLGLLVAKRHRALLH